MPAEYYPELVAAGVESQVLFGTDFPIQGGFYEWADADVAMVLECFYRDELSVICAARYSETVMSGNFRKFLNEPELLEVFNKTYDRQTAKIRNRISH